MPQPLAVLVPLDLDTTDPALALQFVAQLQTAQLLDHACLLHVGHTPAAAQQLEAICQQHPHLPLHGRVLPPDGGGVAHQIGSFALTEGHQLIVAQTKARRGRRRWLESSHLDELLAACPVPLLCLPERPVPPVRRLLFATDLEPAAAINLAQLLPVARQLQAGVVVARIITSSRWETTRQFQHLRREFQEDLLLQDPLAFGQVASFHHYLADALPEGILACAEDLQADVVVMSTRSQRAGWSGLWRSSLTAEVVEQSPLPVLVYRMPPASD